MVSSAMRLEIGLIFEAGGSCSGYREKEVDLWIEVAN